MQPGGLRREELAFYYLERGVIDEDWRRVLIYEVCLLFLGLVEVSRIALCDLGFGVDYRRCFAILLTRWVNLSSPLSS